MKGIKELIIGELTACIYGILKRIIIKFICKNCLRVIWDIVMMEILMNE